VVDGVEAGPVLWAGLRRPGSPYCATLPEQIKYLNVNNLFDETCADRKTNQSQIKQTSE
jgi:hypothetical protein